MFMLTMPASFKIGDTADCRVNKIPQRLTWRDRTTMVLEPNDERAILAHVTEDDLTCFICGGDPSMTAPVDTKTEASYRFGNDSSVDTKHRAGANFGNDGGGVDTKHPAGETFGNDAIGFIRVRKRALKGGGGDPEYRAYLLRSGKTHTASMSFDLVRAVRVNGKPRHQFVLGLGSQKDHERQGLFWFWYYAIGRMERHGLTEPQRQRLIGEMIRKGARVPTIEECQGWTQDRPKAEARVAEIMRALED
jgi:hypothetical protein